MIGEIISAGATLLGGLFGRKKKKEKTETKTVNESVVDYQKMSDNARAAGFNPLTALRNGGAAGFTTTSGTSTSTSTVPTTSALPGALASVGGILGQAFESKIDPLEAKKRQLDTALVDYQLKQLKGGGPVGALWPGSTYSGTKMSRQLMPAVGPSHSKVAATPATMANPRGYQQQPAQQTQLFGSKPGAWWQHHPLVPDMATFEDVYGDEVGQVIGAPIKLIADLGWNMDRAYRYVKGYTDPYVLGAYSKAGKFWKGVGGQSPAEHKALLRGLPKYQAPSPGMHGGGGW
ncbi:hypothetical protein EVB46_004 [Rhizobium phage RHph_TM32]|nr:hypothetical protein EVB33_004 [Rhizobium phage RHph_TM24]QIG67579.1 hypothetical protein EVB45_004 [Rhizobium phage RHph_TM1_7A]QIG67586.1 hypothetical protein EVB46_004 [Rhizobium phage RHph_TM32]